MKIVCATHNPGKLREFAGALAEHGVTLIEQSALGIAEAVEDRLTFVENALIKARHAAAASGLPALADDSGLEVDALGGRPGIHSARFAGPAAGDPENRAALLAALADVPEPLRGARFYCVLVYVRHAEDPRPVIADGLWEGRILTAEVGDRGFGYDPVFFVPDHQCSAAELPLETKQRLSHRGQALRKLAQAFRPTP
ncbi:MAG TPA: RdgB/HAM1 family non-canonical purine NTP pyrophosphatase [Acidiferrobacter sp.]|nr:RdgB/HAM1 family non-canonical purine NTP pyrophosphatase [Acidiferrobacter sp.]